MSWKWRFPSNVWLELLPFLPVKEVQRFGRICVATKEILDTFDVPSGRNVLWKEVATQNFGEVAIDHDGYFDTKPLPLGVSVADLNPLLDIFHKNWFAFWGEDVIHVEVYPKDSTNPDDLYMFKPALKLLSCGVVIPGDVPWFDQIAKCKLELAAQVPEAEHGKFHNDFFITFCKAVLFSKKVIEKAQEHELYCESEAEYYLYPFVMYTAHQKAVPQQTIATDDISGLVGTNSVESTPIDNPMKTVQDLLQELNIYVSLQVLSNEAFPDTSFRVGPPPTNEFRRIFGDPSEFSFSFLQNPHEIDCLQGLRNFVLLFMMVTSRK
eukprot:Lankesteria_metandrocarpae@DN4806_c0_g2_i2.p1